MPGVGLLIFFAVVGSMICARARVAGGAVIFALRRPNPAPGFGHHEIWHLFVLLGSACHFAFILFHVAMA